MASKFGSISERIVGAAIFFVPDGSTLPGSAISGPAVKPGAIAEWEDYIIGRVNQSAYDPVTDSRTRDGFSYTRKKYARETKTWVAEDAFAVTLLDYPETLFDELMYGLASAPVANTPQPIFAKNVWEKLGWTRMLRITEDQETLCDATFRVRLTIQENPPDSIEPGSPILRIAHLADVDPEDEPIVFKPEDEEEPEEP